MTRLAAALPCACVLTTLAAAPAPVAATAPAAAPAAAAEDRLVVAFEPGRPGGRLVVALRSEPKTLNPVVAQDGASRDVIGRLHADLIHIDRESQRTTPALARSWTASPDGRRFTLELRRGVSFSDGRPMDADDVVFSFEAYLDERNHSPQRDLLIVGGQPIRVRKLDAHRVEFSLAQPYAAAERLFDGLAVLPRHLLQQAQSEGRLGQAWGLGANPAEMAGLGPFRFKGHSPGERAVLEPNPHYWKADRAGRRLPYLDEIVFVFVPSEDAQVVRFQAGETDLVTRLGAENFALLQREEKARGLRLLDLGPGLEYAFLFFNLNDDVGVKGLAGIARKQAWFRRTAFRRAVSAAVDREGMVRLAYQGRAAALAGHVTPGNRLWVNTALPRPVRSLERARGLLEEAGFERREDGSLVDPAGAPAEFTVITNSANAARVKLATILQDDLKELGMRVQVVALENRAVLDRVLTSHDYEAAILALGGGDADPNVEMNVWLSGGATHLWNLGQARPATAWEAEIDDLLRRQLSTLEYPARKRLFDRVQEIAAAELPIIPLVAPHILLGARDGLANLRPASLDHYLLWNVDEIYWRAPRPPTPGR